MEALTATQAAALVGKLAILDAHASAGVMRFEVRIVDVKTAYGCTRFLVEPVAGSGRQWVGAERVKVLGHVGGL
jgi:hypothetical protein